MMPLYIFEKDPPSTPPDPALALLREARACIENHLVDWDLLGRIDAHLAARAHLKERG